MVSKFIIISAAITAAAICSLPSGGRAQSKPAEPAQPPAQSPAPPGESLSKKLDKGEGILKPPGGVDPEIQKAPPLGTQDKMPVIIPPGEPGGDQSVQPK